MELTSLEVTGYNNLRVPNTYFRQPTKTTHLGIILPGYRYSVDRAELYYASRILLEQGANLLRVEYAYNQTDFMKLPESKQDNWISNDVFAVCNSVLSQHSYERITLVGKSLGTLAMGHLLSDSLYQKATCIWSTPLLTAEWLCKQIERVKPHSLFIVGTADKYYLPKVLSNLEKETQGYSLVIEGATHALEIPGSISKSLEVQSQIVTELQNFLIEDTENA